MKFRQTLKGFSSETLAIRLKELQNSVLKMSASIDRRILSDYLARSIS